MLPVEFQRMFSKLYDQAPSHPYSIIKPLIERELNVEDIESIFPEFTHEAVASASIAQVHSAVLKNGQKVAVKVQKPEIKAQINADLFCYKIIMYGLEKVFDIPVLWSADYLGEHIRQETDFINETRNSRLCLKNILESRNTALKECCTVPSVFDEFTTRNVMTTEWIDGISMRDIAGLKSSGFEIPSIVSKLVQVFADQIFGSGFVHCDPHPGNIIIREKPRKRSFLFGWLGWQRGADFEIVILDHGLYMKSSSNFRNEYREFWRSLFVLDINSLEEIGASWGVKDLTIFASATLSRPWRKSNMPHLNTPVSIVDTMSENEEYEKQVKLKGRLVAFLQNSDKLPHELLLIGRNINCIRGINMMFKSPVNRINVMAIEAVENIDANNGTLLTGFEVLKFKSVLSFSSFVFWATGVLHNVLSLFGASTGNGRGRFGEGGMDAVLLERIREQVPGFNIDESNFGA